MFPEEIVAFPWSCESYADFVRADWRNPYINCDKWFEVKFSRCSQDALNLDGTFLVSMWCLDPHQILNQVLPLIFKFLVGGHMSNRNLYLDINKYETVVEFRFPPHRKSCSAFLTLTLYIFQCSTWSVQHANRSHTMMVRRMESFIWRAF